VKYQVLVSTSAEKFMKRVPLSDFRNIRHAIYSLADEPWPAQSRTIMGSDFLRIRVGQYRIIYAVDTKEKVVYVERVARRNENTYRGLG
jgi:mRNA interferase RelE/StbE